MALKIVSTPTYQSLEGVIEHPAEFKMVKTLLRATTGPTYDSCFKAFEDKMLGNTDSLVVVSVGIGTYISIHNRFQKMEDGGDGRKT